MASLAQSGSKWLQAELVNADNRILWLFFLQLFILASVINGLLFLFIVISGGDAALQRLIPPFILISSLGKKCN